MADVKGRDHYRPYTSDEFRCLVMANTEVDAGNSTKVVQQFLS